MNTIENRFRLLEHKRTAIMLELDKSITLIDKMLHDLEAVKFLVSQYLDAVDKLNRQPEEKI